MKKKENNITNLNYKNLNIIEKLKFNLENNFEKIKTIYFPILFNLQIFFIYFYLFFNYNYIFIIFLIL